MIEISFGALFGISRRTERAVARHGSIGHMIKAGLVPASWNLRHFYCTPFWGYAVIQTAETHVDLGLTQVSLLCYRSQLR